MKNICFPVQKMSLNSIRNPNIGGLDYSVNEALEAYAKM